ncbi:MAG: DUF4422 domain-containing protein [Acetobacter sp.]|uniref:DUF4422 domain-containing protein n=1 Tax=Acetobacter sp. TaxID=440 RepID=UPI0039E89383
MDIKVYVCHHKPWSTLKNEVFEPIQVGRSLAKTTLPGMLGDDTGDNISHKNKEWCELTALYWIWKNTSHDYVGLMHYRRYVSFNPDIRHDTSINGISAEDIKRNMWTRDGLAATFRTHAVVTSPIYSIHPINLPLMIQSSYEHYCGEHYKKDIDTMMSIIKTKFPEYYIDALHSIYAQKCFFGNIAIMRRDIFNDYCSFLFGVLNEAERQIDVSSYDTYQKRLFGFLAERLSNVFFEHLQSRDKTLKIHHAPMVSVGEEDPVFDSGSIARRIMEKTPQEQDISFGGTINIVMSFDDRYADHAQATIESLLAHTHNGNRIHFHIIHDQRLSRDKIHHLENRYRGLTQFSFYIVQNTFIEKFPLNRDHISINTYYRLVMQDILPASVTRVIYLDSDIIVCDDITTLWNIDLGEKIIGGALDEGGVLQSRRLFGNKANSTYINAGILIFDIGKAVEKYTNLPFYYSEVFYRNQPLITLQDQDIINIAYKDDLHIIPLNWNTNSRIYSANDLDRAYSKDAEQNARENPFIIHFTDSRKPWKFSCLHPLKQLYWFYREKAGLGQPSFYERISKNNTTFRIRSDAKTLYVSSDRINIKIPRKAAIQILKVLRK